MGGALVKDFANCGDVMKSTIDQLRGQRGCGWAASLMARSPGHRCSLAQVAVDDTWWLFTNERGLGSVVRLVPRVRGRPAGTCIDEIKLR